MTKFYAFILPCVCALSFCSGGIASEAILEQAPVAGGMATYVNKTTKYSLEYPTEWQKKDVPKLDLVLFIPNKSPSAQGHASMNAVSENVGTEVTLDQFYTESIANLSAQLKEVNVDSSGRQMINGVATKWVLYTHVMQGLKFQVWQFFIVAKDTIYLLTFSALAENFAEYRNAFEKVAFSFRLLEEPSKSEAPHLTPHPTDLGDKSLPDQA